MPLQKSLPGGRAAIITRVKVLMIGETALIGTSEIPWFGIPAALADSMT